MQIREGRDDDAEELTTLMRASKQSWGYPDEWMRLWEPQLTMDAESIASMRLGVADEEGSIAGFYALLGSGQRVRLEHLWIAPSQMGQGVGRLLMEHALARANAGGAEVLEIDSDPNAESFYLRFGAVRKGEIAAPAPGAPDRTLPMLEVALRG